MRAYSCILSLGLNFEGNKLENRSLSDGVNGVNFVPMMLYRIFEVDKNLRGNKLNLDLQSGSFINEYVCMSIYKMVF